jgi:hypothetical protein
VDTTEYIGIGAPQGNVVIDVQHGANANATVQVPTMYSGYGFITMKGLDLNGTGIYGMLGVNSVANLTVNSGTLKVNGKRMTPSIEKGFARIERRWQKGDTIALSLPLPVRRVIAHPEVKADRGKVALQRGPLVFCLEGPDNDGKVANLVIAGDAPIKAEDRPDLLNRVMVLTGEAQVAKRTTGGGIVAAGTRSFTAIPYYAWAHRGPGEGLEEGVVPTRERPILRPRTGPMGVRENWDAQALRPSRIRRSTSR